MVFDYILHQAALGSVPRSINDPITSNEVNVSGFLNMLVAARDAKVKRFCICGKFFYLWRLKGNAQGRRCHRETTFALCHHQIWSTSFTPTFLPKLTAWKTVGLRYFNVFGRQQDPNGAYAAVIPKFVIQLVNHESPTINGDGSFSRDFTYIDNVIEANIRSLIATKPEAFNTVYNVAYGERTTLNELIELLRNYLAEFDAKN